MTNATEFIKQNIGIIAAGAGGAAVGVGLGVAASAALNSKKKKRYRNTKSKNTRKRSNIHNGKRYTPHTAGKRKDTSHKRIRYTKKGQPYVILSSGKAKFIKKSSAKVSHKRKGGRY